MDTSQLNKVFADSFNTFKVLDTLTVAETGRNFLPVPNTIWQILNHLICWQEYQLDELKGIAPEKNITEVETWTTIVNTNNPQELENRVALFKNQLQFIQEEIRKLAINGSEILKQLKIIQDLTVHLSFHISEIILIRRMTGNYPLPHQMKDFLS